jgi:histidine triad (HIT) family protein
MPDCLFCRILAGEIPGSIVLQEERCAAFLDIHPVNPGHLLVVPRRHAGGLADLDPEDAAAVMRAARRLAGAVRRSGLECDGVNLHLADGEAAGQEIDHVHLHVIPRRRGDGFGLRLPPGYRTAAPDPAALAEVADAIGRAL